MRAADMKTLRPDLGHSHVPTALKNPPCHFAWLAALVVFLLNAQAWSQSSAFTYQGHLMDGGISADGNYDLQFSLQNSLTGGATIGVPQVVAPVTVTNGIFSVTLDFGAAVFDGSDRWVEIGVRPAGSAVAHTVLAPRQRITSNPYAIRAANAATATNASHLTGALSSSNVPAGFVTSAMIANGAVDSQQIAPHAVTSSQIADGAIGSTQMADYAVTAGKLRLGAEAGTEANGSLMVTPGFLAFSHAFAYPFATAPSVTLLSPGWSPPVVDATGFTTSLSVAPVTLDAVNDTGTSSSLALVNGNPAASYYDAASGDLKFVRSLDPQGQTWSAPVMIASLGDVGRYSSLTVVNGFPAIAFIDDTAHQLKFASGLDASGNTWGTPITVIASVNATDVNLIVANNQPAIGFHDSGAHTMAYVRANDANGTAWGATVVVDNTGDTGIYATATVVAGMPALAYWENGGEVRFARASDANGSAWNKPMVVDATTGLGRRVSLAVINGKPAISFADTSNNAIRYVRGLDEHGDSWSTPVDALHGVEGATAVLTAFTGTPAIAFYESGASDLVLTLASDASAMTWSTPVHLDATGNVGAGASIVPVSGGLGISYDQTTNGDLK